MEATEEREREREREERREREREREFAKMREYGRLETKVQVYSTAFTIETSLSFSSNKTNCPSLGWLVWHNNFYSYRVVRASFAQEKRVERLSQMHSTLICSAGNNPIKLFSAVI